MDRLPQELSHRIALCLSLKDATRLATVNKFWRDAAERMIWRVIKIRDSELHEIRQFSYLDCKGSRMINLLRTDPRRRSYVKELDYEASGDSGGLLYVADALDLLGSQLSGLRLEWGISNDYGPNVGDLIYFEQRLRGISPLRQLDRLCLIMPETTMLTTLANILFMTPNLRELVIFSTEYTRVSAMKFAIHWPTMRHLYEVDVALYQKTVPTLAALLSRCPEVAKVNFSFSDEWDLEEATVQQLERITKLPKLRYVRVAPDDYDLDVVTTIFNIPGAFPSVTTIDLDFQFMNYNDSDIIPIPHLPSLRTVIYSDATSDHFSIQAGLTARFVKKHLDDFATHAQLLRIATTSSWGPFDTPLWIEGRVYDGVIVRSFALDGEEDLFHFRYTTAPMSQFTSLQQACLFRLRPYPSSRAEIKPREWRDLVLYRGKVIPLELLIDMYNTLGMDIQWTTPQRRVEVPEICRKKFQEAAEKPVRV